MILRGSDVDGPLLGVTVIDPAGPSLLRLGWRLCPPRDRWVPLEWATFDIGDRTSIVLYTSAAREEHASAAAEAVGPNAIAAEVRIIQGRPMVVLGKRGTPS